MVADEQDLKDDEGETVTLFVSRDSKVVCHKDNAEARLHNYVADPGYHI
jgi:hypothetical protein